ncbi:MAG: hypothetical protein M5U22_00820 [Thermoleophilia bacterium]|nr:hypothetical protein [Thermoleophilia bacterium]
MRLIGAILIGAGVVAVVMVLALVQGGSPNDGAMVISNAVEGSDYVRLRTSVTVRGESSDGERPTFRPEGGAVFGDEVVFLDSTVGSLVTLTFDGSIVEIALDLPEGAGVAKPQFTHIAATLTGTLLVADMTNGQIWQYSREGRVLGAFLDGDERRASGISKPTGVTIDAQGRVLVADAGDQTIKIFNKAGKLLQSFGGAGFSPGRLDHPTDVAVGPDGLTYVADSNNRRVQAFDETGRSVRSFTQTNSALGLLLPRSLALDESGRLHVVDAFAGRVWVFGEEGAFLGSYGSSGAVEERLTLPEGVVIAGERVVVGDRGGGLLRVYGP